MAMQPETSSKPVAACGTEATANKLAEGLRAAGLKARAFPLVKLAVRADWHAGLDLDSFEWLVLSSPTAAQLMVGALNGIYTGRIACIGQSTAAVMKQAGFSVAVVPATQNRKGLLDEMAKITNGKTLLLPVSDAAPSELMDGLKRLRFKVTAPVTYANQPDMPSVQDFARALDGGDFDAAAFTSGSAFKYASPARGIERLRIYCIGPSTAEVVWGHKLKVAGVAEHHSVGGLVKTIAEAEKRG
jgi:uroporphyrinogen III methyltransferase/synthase